MAGGTGLASYSSTLTISTVDTVIFADASSNPVRYGYVTVENLGATNPIYVTTDGSTPAVAGANCYAVAPGERTLLANGLLLWYQSSKAIPQGVNQFGGGSTSTGPGSPGEVQSQRSLAGAMTNPGTTVKLISAGAQAYTVSAAG